MGLANAEAYFGCKGEQNPGMENPLLRTKMITKMLSPWIIHPGKSLGSQRDWSFQIKPKGG
jgi:hypothetical protein